MASAAHRTALVVGVANSRSLAWYSAVSLLRKNYNVVVTYQNERFEASVDKLVKSFLEEQEQKGINDANILPKLASVPCDVASDEDIQQLFSTRLPQVLHETFQAEKIQLDALVHSIAYATAESMKPIESIRFPFLQTSRKSFQIAHDVSSYSLLALCNNALPLFTPNSSSITTLTYIGSSRAVPGYNVMGPAKASLEATVRGLACDLGPSPYGIRVNAVSAGPVSTMAARGIKNFSNMKQNVVDQAPLRRNVSAEEVGDVVAFLADGDNGASAITGQVIFVDNGYSIV